MARRDKQIEGDDGRTIVNMNVEGMPGYLPERKEPAGKGEQFSRREMRLFTWGAVKAALLVAGVMCLGLVLFVLFCKYIWFR